MVWFKFFFGALHLMKMKLEAHLFTPDYIDLKKTVKKMQKGKNQLADSDDEKGQKLGVDDYWQDLAD